MKFSAMVLDQNAADAVIKFVCRRFGVKLWQLRCDSRERNLVHARHMAAWLMLQRGLQVADIARLLARDHSTISIALKKIERERAKNRKVAAELDEMRRAS